MSKEQQKQRKKHSRVEENHNYILSDFAHHPNRTIKEHSDALGVEPETVRGYYDSLVAEGLASKTEIVLTRKGMAGYQRFWVFVETTYETEKNYETEDERLNRPAPDYQKVLSKAVEAKLLTKKWRDRLILRSIDVILGSDYDLVMLIDAKDHDAMHDFITRVLRTRPFVLRTSTGWARSAADIPGGKVERDGNALDDESSE